MAIGLKIPYVEGQKAVFTKFDRRKEVDLSTVCATVGKFGEDYRVAIGSCAPTPIRLPKTEALLKGKKLTPRSSSVRQRSLPAARFLPSATSVLPPSTASAW